MHTSMNFIPLCPVCRWLCGLWSPSSLTSHILGATQRHGGGEHHRPMALNPRSHPPGMHYSEREKERDFGLCKKKKITNVTFNMLFQSGQLIKKWTVSQKKRDTCKTDLKTQCWDQLWCMDFFRPVFHFWVTIRQQWVISVGVGWDAVRVLPSKVSKINNTLVPASFQINFRDVKETQWQSKMTNISRHARTFSHKCTHAPTNTALHT